jgi:NAD(P)-dependent dehydrogenase (short-subunit alcohol dehydrogenase family)
MLQCGETAVPAKATGSPSTVLVTGASSGIGEALARCFARDDARIGSITLAERHPA